MGWHIAVLPWLAHAVIGGSVFLLAGAVAVRLSRQPIRRIRLIEITLAGTLAVPWVSQLAWLPHWSTGLLASLAPVDIAPPPAPTHTGASLALVAPLPDDISQARPNASPIPAAPAPVNAAPPAPKGTVNNSMLGFPVMIVSLYGFIVLALLLRILVGAVSLARLYRATFPVGPEVTDAFHEVAGPAGTGVRLRASDHILVPVTFRGWRPTIVLPRALCEPGEQAALPYCLAHEWSHIQGGDVARWYIANLVQSLYFFNPLCWWLRRELRLCQDYLADALAANYAQHPEDYAVYLVGLARRG